MPAEDAANHFVSRVKMNAQPLLGRGEDAVVPVILDGENAWEFFPRSGREFLRLLYTKLGEDTDIECVTCSELLSQVKAEPLANLLPGSWINSNFNVWIGAAHYRRDRHGSAMHGKQLVFDSLYAGIDLEQLYVRVDLLPDFLDESGERLQADLDIQLALALHAGDGSEKSLTEISVSLRDGKVSQVNAPFSVESAAGNSLVIALALDELHARIGDTLRLHTVAWKNNLPLDALPAEGTIELPIVTEETLASTTVGEHWSA
jgi:hypothetical protein